jgi:hypothetical protein
MKLASRVVVLAASLAFVTCLAASAAAQTDPQIGVWKLNPAKSKYSPGPAPKSGITKIEAAGTGSKVTVDQPMADGSMRHYEYTSNYDGKDVKVVGNYPEADMVARTRVDAHTVKSVYKKGGKVTTTQMSVVSSDGKTRTVTTTGNGANGKPVNNVSVFEKQ